MTGPSRLLMMISGPGPTGPDNAFGGGDFERFRDASAPGDQANRLISEVNPILVETTYAYDAAGNRTGKVDGNGNPIVYTYDANRQLTKVEFADDTAYDYAFDAHGQRTLERSADHERELFYDDLHRLVRVEDNTLGRTSTYTVAPGPSPCAGAPSGPR